MHSKRRISRYQVELGQKLDKNVLFESSSISFGKWNLKNGAFPNLDMCKSCIYQKICTCAFGKVNYFSGPQFDQSEGGGIRNHKHTSAQSNAHTNSQRRDFRERDFRC